MLSESGEREQSFDASNTPYAAIGGAEGVHQLAQTFYDLMERQSQFAELRALHGEDLTEAREKFYDFLSGWLGGPPLFMQKHGHPRLRMRHAPFPIGPLERDQWLACMTMAMDTCEIDGPLREFLDGRFTHVANFMQNRA